MTQVEALAQMKEGWLYDSEGDGALTQNAEALTQNAEALTQNAEALTQNPKGGRSYIAVALLALAIPGCI